MAESIGIMQPYLFPYLGYFSLIKHTDEWIVFDTVQFINKGWINRNRILKQGGDNVGFLTVPVKKASRDMLIKDVLIDKEQRWKSKIFGQLTYYKKKAPFYEPTMKIVNVILEFETNNINELNVFALEKICDYLGIRFKFSFFSKNNYGIDTVAAPDEWALKITKHLNFKTYINLPGGINFFDLEKYKRENIDLKFLAIKLEPYKTFNDRFIPGLSIIDVMMFNSPQRINEMLDNYEFI